MSHAEIQNEKLSNINLLNKLFYDHNANRYGIISILLLIVGCSGGIAVGLGALSSTVQLIFLVMPTMIALAMILAVAPMRYIIFSSIIAVFIDIVVILINALS